MDAFRTQVAWHFGHTAVQVAICVFFLAGLALGPPLARRLGWRPSGTVLAIWGLGGALSVTFISRIGRHDFVLDPATVGQCLSGLSKPWLSPDSVLNLVMLLPLGAGLMLASRRYSVAITGVVALAVWIELSQGLSGLGACERGDIVRNTIGGLVGLALVRLFQRPESDDSSRLRTIPAQLSHRMPPSTGPADSPLDATPQLPKPRSASPPTRARWNQSPEERPDRLG
ncbi:MAG: VanZ family protein [Actinomycetia bacterium]|nr:VanZ family protein [Actinomycetes bacterium]